MDSLDKNYIDILDKVIKDTTIYFNPLTKQFDQLYTSAESNRHFDKDFFPVKRYIQSSNSADMLTYMRRYSGSYASAFVNKYGIIVKSVKAEEHIGDTYATPIRFIFGGDSLSVSYNRKDGLDKIGLQLIPYSYKKLSDNMSSMDYIKMSARDMSLRFTDYGNPEALKNFFDEMAKTYPKDKDAINLIYMLYNKLDLGAKEYNIAKDYF